MNVCAVPVHSENRPNKEKKHKPTKTMGIGRWNYARACPKIELCNFMVMYYNFESMNDWSCSYNFSPEATDIFFLKWKFCSSSENETLNCHDYVGWGFRWSSFRELHWTQRRSCTPPTAKPRRNGRSLEAKLNQLALATSLYLPSSCLVNESLPGNERTTFHALPKSV